MPQFIRIKHYIINIDAITYIRVEENHIDFGFAFPTERPGGQNYVRLERGVGLSNDEFDEIKEFALGSKAVADEIIDLKAISIIGGGDTAAYVDNHGIHDKFTWVSTGGGASLELMSGKELPGVAALRDSAHA